MTVIKGYYAKLNNMGDLLSEYLFPMITGAQVQHCEDVAKFDVMGVGSCGGALWANKEDGLTGMAKDMVKSAKCLMTGAPCAVWGTGFLKDYSDRQLRLIRRNVSFIAVRGAKSRAIIEKSLGRKIDPVMCDGGILSAELIRDKVEKKYAVGFIPHYNEQALIESNGLRAAFEKKYDRAVIINLRDDPLEVIRRIGECETIISSSLHGCVVADSFYIPNMRVRLSDIPGTGFKFDDYYSGYGLTIPARVLAGEADLPSLAQVADSYALTAGMVDEKKQQMTSCLADFVKSQLK